MFAIYLTDEAKKQLSRLESDRSLKKRYKAVNKTIRLLAANPRHPGLQTHHFTSLKGPSGEKIFEAYAEQAAPTASRVFWYYGPGRKKITIVTITPHP